MALTKITSGVISNEFQTSSTINGSLWSAAIDWNSSQVWRVTPNNALTLSFTDYKIGMVKIIVAIGSGSASAVLNFPSQAILLGGAMDTTSGAKNFIQIVCTVDGSSPEFFYTISQQAT
tara:strand:+ start:512 stop:868 length:357 start_codon:yes stop_codon:yes gene_type:complete